jgi:hypothetical protein
MARAKPGVIIRKLERLPMECSSKDIRLYKKEKEMGVDCSMILRADELHQLSSHEEKIAYIRALEDRLIKKYGIAKREDAITYEDFDDENNMRFDFEPYDIISLNMYDGFWEIESGYHYSQYFSDDGRSTGVRRLFFDIARDLGCNDGYVCSEHCTWNGEDMESLNLQEWLEHMRARFGEIKEYNPTIEYGNYDDRFPEVFHDDFAECKQELRELEEVVEKLGFSANGLDTICGQFLIVSKEGRSYVLDRATNELLIPDAVDFYQDLNCCGFEIESNGKRFLFSSEGHKIFETDKGHFCWEWYSSSDPRFMSVRLFNRESGQEAIAVDRGEYQKEIKKYYVFRKYVDSNENVLIPEYQR